MNVLSLCNHQDKKVMNVKLMKTVKMTLSVVTKNVWSLLVKKEILATFTGNVKIDFGASIINASHKVNLESHATLNTNA